jgi:hypothetical protein
MHIFTPWALAINLTTNGIGIPPSIPYSTSIKRFPSIGMAKLFENNLDLIQIFSLGLVAEFPHGGHVVADKENRAADTFGAVAA